MSLLLCNLLFLLRFLASDPSGYRKDGVTESESRKAENRRYTLLITWISGVTRMPVAGHGILPGAAREMIPYRIPTYFP